MIQLRTYRSGGTAAFYPTTKFYAVILDERGNWLGETGKCKTRESAAAAGERLASKLIG